LSKDTIIHKNSNVQYVLPGRWWSLPHIAILLTLHVDVGAPVEQQLDHLLVASTPNRLQWVAKISSLCVGIGTLGCVAKGSVADPASIGSLRIQNCNILKARDLFPHR